MSIGPTTTNAPCRGTTVKVAVPYEDVFFNSGVTLGIIYIQGKSVLHPVNRATHFQAARFLDEISVDTVWKTFTETWVLSYVGAPYNVLHDQETQLVSARFQAMAAEAGTTSRPVGIEAPNAMSVGEGCHAPLRKTFIKLKESYGIDPLAKEVETTSETLFGRQKSVSKRISRPTGVDDGYLLAVSIMCINSTEGCEGIFPTLLVFGAMPKIPLPDSGPSAVSQEVRMMMVDPARDEYLRIVAKCASSKQRKHSSQVHPRQLSSMATRFWCTATHQTDGNRGCSSQGMNTASLYTSRIGIFTKMPSVE